MADGDTELMPDIGLLTTLWYSDTKTGTRTQIAWIDGDEGIPALEDAPDQVTGTVLDLDYEMARPGIKKASDIEVPIYYTHKQHKALKAVENTNLYFFLKFPDNSAEGDEEPLVKTFYGKYRLIGDTITTADFIKEKIKIYKAGDVEESYGFPTA